MQEKNWSVYLLECKDGSFYTGISDNVQKRMEKHKSGKGSKYVSAKGFYRLIAFKEYSNKSEALKAEYGVKQLPKEEKLNFFTNGKSI
jgi:putative endonuclease